MSIRTVSEDDIAGASETGGPWIRQDVITYDPVDVNVTAKFYETTTITTMVYNAILDVLEMPRDTDEMDLLIQIVKMVEERPKTVAGPPPGLIPRIASPRPQWRPDLDADQ